jgi:photosystem II stability/assembly factor-like uncharacterized protein
VSLPPVDLSRPARLAAVEFVTPQVGWLAVNSLRLGQPPQALLFKTTDGGQHWALKLAWDGGAEEQSDGSPARWMRFFNPREGLVITPAAAPLPTLYRTTDGGEHWWAVHVPAGGAIGFVDFRHGLLAGIDADPNRGWALFQTSDAGDNWLGLARITLSIPVSQGLDSRTDARGLLLRGQGRAWFGAATSARSSPLVFMTTDGGRNWRSQSLAAPPELPSDRIVASFSYVPELLDGTRPLLPVEIQDVESPGGKSPGSGIYLYSSGDGGRSWSAPQLLRRAPSGQFVTWKLLDGTHWWVAIGRTVWASSDGGLNWSSTEVDLPDGYRISRLSFATPRDGWAIAVTAARGPGSRLLHTVDGGAHWVVVLNPSSS